MMMMSEAQYQYAQLANQTNAIRPNVKPSDTAFLRVAEAKSDVETLVKHIEATVANLIGDEPTSQCADDKKPIRPGLLGEVHESAEAISYAVGRATSALNRLVKVMG